MPKLISGRAYNLQCDFEKIFYAFFPDGEFNTTSRISKVNEYSFKSEGKVYMIPGWTEVYRKNETGQGGMLPALVDGDGAPPQANIIERKIIEDETRPPAAYNEATLLTAMEGAGKLLDDEDFAEAMKDSGLGTPGTRAQMIEHLLASKYITGETTDLKATPKAEDSLSFLKSVNIETLSSPVLTGEWEDKLRQMENGSFIRENFMQEISDLTEAILCPFDRCFLYNFIGKHV
jgi:DNA topoisomerase-3